METGNNWQDERKKENKRRNWQKKFFVEWKMMAETFIAVGICDEMQRLATIQTKSPEILFNRNN